MTVVDFCIVRKTHLSKTSKYVQDSCVFRNVPRPCTPLRRWMITTSILLITLPRISNQFTNESHFFPSLNSVLLTSFARLCVCGEGGGIKKLSHPSGTNASYISIYSVLWDGKRHRQKVKKSKMTKWGKCQSEGIVELQRSTWWSYCSLILI